MITVSSLAKTFPGPVEALTDIDLQIEDGEFVTLIGRSGCGKSTLLNLIAGLLPPTRGTITLDGVVVSEPRRDVAMVFQQPALLPWRSVEANVLLPAEIMGLRGAGPRALELLEMTGLTAFRKKRPHELSGGMQQRVALCRALLPRPKVLLMDEPFSALDALTREELAVELQRIHLDLGTTIVFVTHSIQEAVLLADRVVVLTDRPGRIRSLVPIDIPRPRSFGHNAHLDEVAATAARLHDLLH
ncbi:ABC transporter ATP-binding protein [Actinoplanes solisilvae]|uniref:ABC transporter ATP-binding protein n=1 Tax=Actinoplanes solisilvae TaxID=2486853 RepID=UPI000FD7A5F5|nr:ABC transporter ATP-binding protein [Actinoplanes solisilvae]